jgi:hypothetical protein
MTRCSRCWKSSSNGLTNWSAESGQLSIPLPSPLGKWIATSRPSNNMWHGRRKLRHPAGTGRTVHSALILLVLRAFSSGCTALTGVEAISNGVPAANTAYNGFPILSSILAQDRYLPRQLHTRGDRLAFSNGLVLLSAIAGALIYAFDGSTTRLIQL